MKKFNVRLDLNLSRKDTWKVITDVENYPSFIKYLHNVRVPEPLKEGSHWDDWTNILYIPLHFNHTNLKLVPEKIFEFRFPLPFNGYVLQRFEIIEGDNPTTVNYTLTFDLGLKIAELTVGKILEMRWHDVMDNAVLRLREKYGD